MHTTTTTPTPAALANLSRTPTSPRPHVHHLHLRTLPLESTSPRMRWAMLTSTGLSTGEADNMAVLMEQLIDRIKVDYPDYAETGVEIHYGWTHKTIIFRAPMLEYLGWVCPSVTMAGLGADYNSALINSWLKRVLIAQSPRPALPPASSDMTVEPEEQRPCTPYVIATDASMSGHRGGWAYVTQDGHYRHAHHKLARRDVTWLEEKAILKAIYDHQSEAKARGLVIVSDSRHAVNRVRQFLWHHHELGDNIHVVWTRGHAGHILNDAADRISRYARVGEGMVSEDTCARIANDAAQLWRTGKRVDSHLVAVA